MFFRFSNLDDAHKTNPTSNRLLTSTTASQVLHDPSPYQEIEA